MGIRCSEKSAIDGAFKDLRMLAGFLDFDALDTQLVKSGCRGVQNASNQLEVRIVAQFPIAFDVGRASHDFGNFVYLMGALFFARRLNFCFFVEAPA